MIDIQNRREVFWDDFLIDPDKTTADKVLHHPRRRERSLVYDRPWEGDCGNCFNVLWDNGIYRMYYLSTWQKDPKTGKRWEDYNICYAESRDGIRWMKPDLGLYPFGRCRHTNIIVPQKPDHLGDFSVIIDPNQPEGSPERYKGVCSCNGKLWCYTSSDGIRFTKAWMMTDKGSFDTTNTAFWSESMKKYVGYIRNVHKDPTGQFNIRDIRYMVSDDFHTWSDPVPLEYGDPYDFQMYTNGVFPYPRAEHLFVGFPTRYTERKEWTKNYDQLTNPEERRYRMTQGDPRYGLALTDSLFMTSRDGLHWDRTEEAYLCPGPEEANNWIYGDCYPAKGFAVTPGKTPDSDTELSTYMNCRHWTGIPSEVWRYSIRTDGFVSRHGSYRGQKVVTKPFLYRGSRMTINFRTSAAGKAVITLRSEDGRELHTCDLFGDRVDRPVEFENGSPEELQGTPVVLEIELHDADIYSFRFE